MVVFGILLVVFLLICAVLCLLILIQSDKGGGISGAIGGLSGASNFLGTQDTANVLTKGTYVLGGVFLVLCMLMTFFAPGGGMAKSGMQKRAERVQGITATPASGVGMEFADDAGAGGAGGSAVSAGNVEIVGGGEGSGPMIIGDIIEGGTVKRLEDGVLKEVDKAAGQ